MALKLLSLLVIAAVLLAQGIYVLWTGQTIPFFAKREYQHSPVGLLRRLVFAFAYLFPVGMMSFIAIRTIDGEVISQFRDWFAKNGGILFWMSSLAIAGALCLAQPARMLRWMLREHPALADDRKMLIVTRLIGSGILFMWLLMLAKL